MNNASRITAAIAALLVSHCRTVPATADLKDAGATGLAAPGGPAAWRTWAERMGMTVDADAAGLRIASVQPTQFARVIGLRGGDVIVALNGRPVANVQDFEGVATAFALGTNGSWDGVWSFRVQRGGKTKAVQPPQGYDCNPFVLAECGPLTGS